MVCLIQQILDHFQGQRPESENRLYNRPEPDFGETPLYAASKRGHSRIVETLITMGHIDVNRSTKNRTTPLMVSSVGGYLEIIAMLLAHPKIDPNCLSHPNDLPDLVTAVKGVILHSIYDNSTLILTFLNFV